MTEEGVRALAYSGKLMRPSPLPPTVRSVMRELERSLAHFDEVRPYVVVDGEGVVGGGGGGGGGGGAEARTKKEAREGSLTAPYAITTRTRDPLADSVPIRITAGYGRGRLASYRRGTAIIDVSPFVPFRYLILRRRLRCRRRRDGRNGKKGPGTGEERRRHDTDASATPAVVRLFPGDVVVMWGRCILVKYISREPG